MSYDLTLKRPAGGLTRASIKAAVEGMNKEDPVATWAFDADGNVRRGLEIDASHDDAARVHLALSKNGRSVSVSVGGHAATFAYFVLASLAVRLDAALFDPQQDPARQVVSRGSLPRESALAAVREHEAVMLEKRRHQPYDGPEEAGSDAEDLLDWLEENRIIEVRQRDASVVALVRAGVDPRKLYDALLEAPAVEEVFVSESEFVDAVGRFLASVPPSSAVR